jgi:uncharacterized protein (DUF58 family)
MTRASEGVRPQDLLAKVRLLEMVARRNAAGLLAGDYVTTIPGQGLLFHETRKYVQGEPARRIDWNITARLGEPYVKVHLEERQRDVVIAVDVSPSMHVGFQERTKLETAIELAATLSVAAIDSGDRLGWVVFADQEIEHARPRGGKPQLFRALRSLLAHTEPWERQVDASDPRAAIHAIEAIRGRRFVVFMISDFIDHDVPEDLRFLRARHDVSLLHVFDPVEYSATDAIRFSAQAAEGERPGSKRPSSIHPGDAGGLPEMSAFLAREASRHRISVGSFSTADPVGDSLGRFLHTKRRQTYR